MHTNAKSILVSVITPSYNQAPFIEQTIHSVLGQNHSPIEYFIVDGGSTDGSQEIIQRYAGHLAGWVSEPDEGQADAINKGFRQATGEIVAWLNSDDLFAPGAVSRAVKGFKENPEAGMVFGNAATIDQHGRPLNDLIFGGHDLKALMAFNIICQPAVFLRRQLLMESGFLDPSFRYLLDHHLWLRVARLAPTIHVPEVLAYARHHPGAKNVAEAAGFGAEAYRILDWVQTQPDLVTLHTREHKRIVAGAHRFNARYLLEGGLPKQAIAAYWQSLKNDPLTALKEWHRILFALLSVLGAGQLGPLYYRIRKERLPKSARQMGIENVSQLYSPPARTSM